MELINKNEVNINKISVRSIMNIGTWNIRTLTDIGRFEDAKHYMETFKINILGLSEMRWKGAGETTSNGHKIIYSGGDTNERGVGVIIRPEMAKAVKGFWTLSDRIVLVKLSGSPVDLNIIQVYAPTSTSTESDIDEFYRGLDTVTKQCKAHELTLVIGDFNAKVGNTETPGVTGKFGLGDRNERGEKLVEWAEVNNMLVGNTLFQQHPRRLWTWESPGNRTRNQIDYILINKRYKSALISTNTRPAARGISNHVPVVSKLKIKLKNLKRSKRSVRLNIDILNSDMELKNKYNVAIQNRYNAMEIITTIDDQWEMLKESVVQASQEY